MIREITDNEELERLAPILSGHFRKVLEQLNLQGETIPGIENFTQPDRYLSTMKFFEERLFVLEDAGRQVGFLAICPVKDGVCTFGRLIMEPEDRDGPHGETMLEFLETEARRLGATLLQCGLIHDLEEMREWFVRHGFEIAAVKDVPTLPFKICMLKKNL